MKYLKSTWVEYEKFYTELRVRYYRDVVLNSTQQRGHNTHKFCINFQLLYMCHQGVQDVSVSLANGVGSRCSASLYFSVRSVHPFSQLSPSSQRAMQLEHTQSFRTYYWEVSEFSFVRGKWRFGDQEIVRKRTYLLRQSQTFAPILQPSVFPGEKRARANTHTHTYILYILTWMIHLYLFIVSIFPYPFVLYALCLSTALSIYSCILCPSAALSVFSCMGDIAQVSSLRLRGGADVTEPVWLTRMHPPTPTPTGDGNQVYGQNHSRWSSAVTGKRPLLVCVCL
jgi:hypothetical protein